MSDGDSQKYGIEFTRNAVKDLKKLAKSVLRRVDTKIASLADNPRPSGIRKLENEDDLYRVRVGDYRIIYEIDNEKRIVTIARVRERGEVYDNL